MGSSFPALYRNPTYPVLSRSSNDPVSRARRRMEDEESVNSDTTLELHLSDGQFNARASCMDKCYNASHQATSAS